jgi:carbon storage regulator CsrA
MLVLSRKSRESVVVGGADGFHRLLKVTVLGVHGTNVKLGFEVDPDIPVHRSEVWEQINGNGRQKAQAEGLPDPVKTDGRDRNSTAVHD